VAMHLIMRIRMRQLELFDKIPASLNLALQRYHSLVYPSLT
jgi:hypothetical protein